MAQNNFVQWNPAGANQETDAQYAADAQRTGGAVDGALFDAATANKLFFQLTAFTAAFAAMMAAKGYNMLDSNIQALQGAFASIMTQVDMAGYAPLANPAFTGVPTSPNPAANDDSQQIATTHYVRGKALPSGTGYQVLPNGVTFEWISGPWQPADGTEPYDLQAWPLVFPNSVLFAQISMQLQGPTTAMDSWYQLVGYNNVSVSYQRQHGDGGSYQTQTRALILGIGY